jgi:hypothetical protein
MAKTIGQLTQATTLASGDEFVIEQSGLTKRVAASVVRGGLVNADIDAAAAIAFSKLASLDSANILVGNGSNVATKVAVTGDVTISNAGVTAIGSSKVVTAMVNDAAITTAKVNNGAITAVKLDGVPKDNSGNDLSVGSMPAFACRAWVNFDGTSSVVVGAETRCTIRASGNVSKVVRNGTGDYTVFFLTAMTDANYVVVASHGNGAVSGAFSFNAPFGTPTTSGVRVAATTVAVPPVLTNADYVNVAIFR